MIVTSNISGVVCKFLGGKFTGNTVSRLANKEFKGNINSLAQELRGTGPTDFGITKSTVPITTEGDHRSPVLA